MSTFKNIESFIWWFENGYGIQPNVKIQPSRDYRKGSDINLITRAIFFNDIPPLRKSKFDYPDITHFYIHRYLLELQDEFKKYNTSYPPVLQWACKRYANSIIKLNQMRLRNWNFEPLNI